MQQLRSPLFVPKEWQRPRLRPSEKETLCGTVSTWTGSSARATTIESDSTLEAKIEQIVKEAYRKGAQDGIEPEVTAAIERLRDDFGQHFKTIESELAEIRQALSGAKEAAPQEQEPLKSLYELCDSSNDEDALDLLYCHVDRLLSSGDFGACNTLLCDSKLNRLTPAVLIGLLTTTLAARDRLPARSALVESIRKRLLCFYSEAETAQNLSGLE